MKHAAFVIANNSSVPYFNWFAAEASKRKNLKITFVALFPERPKMIDDVRDFGFECLWVKFDCNKRIRSWISSSVELYKILRKLKPDIVLSNLFDDAIPVVIAGTLAGIKKRVVVKADTSFHWNFARKGVIFDYMINFLATDLIAISEESEKFMLEKEGAKPSKITLIHHGIPVTDLKKAISNEIVNEFKEEFKLNGKEVIGVVARLIKWKGHLNIVEAAVEFCQKYPNVVFVFVGTGDEEESLKKRIAELKLNDHFIFTGWISPDKMPSVFSSFDIFLHAASMEPFGFVIIEAMAFSLPVVSSRTGAAGDAITHKENGYLFTSGSSKALQEGLEWIINNPELNKVKSLGAKIAETKFDFKVMYENYLRLFEK